MADELESDSDENEANSEESGPEENDNREIEEGRFDGQEGMTAEEVRNLEKTVKLVQHVLVKV